MPLRRVIRLKTKVSLSQQCPPLLTIHLPLTLKAVDEQTTDDGGDVPRMQLDRNGGPVTELREKMMNGVPDPGSRVTPLC